MAMVESGEVEFSSITARILPLHPALRILFEWFLAVLTLQSSVNQQKWMCTESWEHLTASCTYSKHINVIFKKFGLNLIQFHGCCL